MENYTKIGETADIGFEQSKAILRIAYLLASVDGVICEKEQEQFRVLMRYLFGERYAEVGVMSYLEDVSEEARKLVGLRAFYTKDAELVRAFIAKAVSSLRMIVQDTYVLRCAFAIWINICCADEKYNRIERLAIKGIQQMVNPNALPQKGKVKAGVEAKGASTIDLYDIRLFPLIDLSAIYDGTSITDAFLAEIEKRVKRIDEITVKLDSTENDLSRQNYKDMYDFEISNLKEFLANK